MRVPPTDLALGELRAALEQGWGLAPVALEYAPLGYGAHHWVATDDAGKRWWLSVHECGDAAAFAALRAAMAAAVALHRAGLQFVLAAVPTAREEPIAPLGGRYALDLQPFVDGRPVDAVPSGTVDLLARLHDATAVAEGVAERDDLEVPARAALEGSLAALEEPWRHGPFGEPCRSLLLASAPSVRAALERYDALAGGMQRQPVVITHGEPKPDNLLRTADGDLLIDWDTARLAPPARDLWWLAAQDPSAVDAYEHRTGRPVSAASLELYRLRWPLTDLALFVQQLRAPHEDDADTRVAWGAVEAILADGGFAS